MSTALKDMYSKEYIVTFATNVKEVYAKFDVESFVVNTMDASWDELSLMARMKQIAKQLGLHLPNKYPEAIAIVLDVSNHVNGFFSLFFPEFVVQFGQEEQHWELSMHALEELTKKSSAEFAIRPFLLKDPKRAMKQMMKWSKHKNEHVRRLSSEGCRPRLPWGVSLPMFKEDPTMVLEILECLKEDSSLYVRTSVANNLNDIAKDNPELVIELCKKWKGTSKDTDWIIRKGCRNLVRQANPEVMELFGYANVEDKNFATNATIHMNPKKLKIGEDSIISYELDIRNGAPVHIRIEYGIDFVKANGTCSRKLFLLSDKVVEGGSHLEALRNHSWENLTTRKHYPGEHSIVLLVNGKEIAKTKIILA